MPFFNASVTLVGNATRDPELRFTPSGKSVVDLGIAVNYSRKVGDKYEDDPSYFDLVIWGELGEHVVESIAKGTRVIVVGSPKQQRWETDDGNRSRVVINVEAIGPDLTWATANVTRTQGSGNRGPSAAEFAAQQEGGGQRAQTQAPATNGDPGPQYQYDDEPF